MIIDTAPFALFISHTNNSSPGLLEDVKGDGDFLDLVRVGVTLLLKLVSDIITEDSGMSGCKVSASETKIYKSYLNF
jgi:hypothetical protein